MQVEFWCVWEGETSNDYKERQKSIIAELQRQKIPIDPIDSFIGENSQQGTWSKPKIGPAFKAVLLEGTWTRPNEGDMIEVHARNYFETNHGVYFAAADRIYSATALSNEPYSLVKVLVKSNTETASGMAFP